MKYFRHVLKVALGVGLVVGLFIFSTLLYISDFSARSTGSVGSAVPQDASAAAPVAQANQPIEQRALQWIFGPPEQASAASSTEAAP